MACKFVCFEEDGPQGESRSGYDVRMKIYNCNTCVYQECRCREICPPALPEQEEPDGTAGSPEQPGYPGVPGKPIIIPDCWANDYYRRIHKT